MVKVSVIIPVYNIENYLNECLDSVVNQTFEDIEIICIDDGSTDNSLNILQSYANSDDRIKILSKQNSGQGSARNLGFKKSQGEYIYFVDGDDYIDLKTIEKFYNNAISNNSEIVISKIARFKDKNSIDYSVPGFDFEEIFKNQDFNNFLFDYHEVKKYVLNASFAPWTKFYRRDFLVNHNILFVENLYYEDVLFHIEVMLSAEKMSFLPEFNYYYRINPSSSVHTGDNGYDIFEIINLVEEYLINEDYYEEFRGEFDLFKITQILNYVSVTKTEEYFQKAKTEFSKIEVSSNHLISHALLDKYEILLNADNYHEFEIKNYYNLKDESFKMYGAAILDIKNIGDLNNSFDIVSSSCDESDVFTTSVIKDDECKELLIHAYGNSLDLSLKCIGDGNLVINLRSIDVKDRNNKRFPVYMNYTSLKINDEEYIEENKLISHDSSLVFKRHVSDSEIIKIHLNWSSFIDSSVYIDEFELIQEKYDNLNRKYKSLNKNVDKLKKEVNDLNKENNELNNALDEVYSSNSWKMIGPLRNLRRKL